MIAFADEVDGLHFDIPEAEYHAHPGSLSSTGAKLLATRTPAEFRHNQLNGRAPKKVFDLGTLVHKIVLGAGATIVTVDAADWRTKAAKEERDQAYADGKTPVLERDWQRAERMADALSLSKTATDLLSVGAPEVSMLGTDPETGVRLRGRLDWLRPDAVVDFKTAADASPHAFARAAGDFGYYQQDPFYRDLLNLLGSPVDDFIFIVQSTEPPHLVSVNRLTHDDVVDGRTANRRAITTYAICTDTGNWPGYGDQINTISVPPFKKK
ncbi:PD-(D/E)XK nuclease-like domain-containing protein [Tsukamurella tyrosinosolvens]|uniref:PD-(D/E)XK nuclease-like domain-containing protein n=1 Tax=Tsukamurella tyrosinosolvens TaxID=57704 RepID=UPI0007B2AF26|nr:PD-(D/E)XK nuclease-like domain-containing protein [Tsukamurella tyrosinosolvens]KZL96975.1 hypothetical protein AXX05_15960 [Tsukamurella tyrosinosolvens]